MAEKPITQIKVEKWLGRISDFSAHKLPPGAAVVQENFRCQTPGQMDVRPGYRSANVSAPAATLNVITYPYPSGTDWLLLHASDGTVTPVHPT